MRDSTTLQELIVQAFDIVQAAGGKVEFPYAHPLTGSKTTVKCYKVGSNIRLDIIQEP